MNIIEDFPQFNFEPGRFNMWSPFSNTITYAAHRMKTNNGRLGLLHELGHAILNHRSYKYDMELLTMELDAWDIARELAPRYGVTIDESHIEQSISTYDEWLSKRATCPECTSFSLQKGRAQFGCFACGTLWQVNERKDRRVMRTITSRAKIHNLAPSY